MPTRRLDPFLNRVAEDIRAHELMPPQARVLVGVSGGLDSVALLHVLRALGHNVRAAHVNYGLRGAESDGDEDSVRALCNETGVPLAVARLDARQEAASSGTSLQAAARDLRYAFFRQTAEAEGIEAVAVAHHADDQAETFFLNLLRGAGPEGLAGMPAGRPLAPGCPVQLVRPFLFQKRDGIRDYALRNGLAWREDSGNASMSYVRSKVRHSLIPFLREQFGFDSPDMAARSATLLRRYVDETLSVALDALWAEAVRDVHLENALRVELLLKAGPALRSGLILRALERWLPGAPLSSAVAVEVEKLLSSQSGRRVEFGAGTVWRERDLLRFVPLLPSDQSGGEAVRLAAPDGTATWPGGSLTIELLPSIPEWLDAGDSDTAYADADRLAPVLEIRPWRSGDRFRPIGMPGTKKVSDYLTDAGVPSSRRRDVYVLCSGDQIAWLVGLRLSDAVKVSPETRRVAKITFVPRKR